MSTSASWALIVGGSSGIGLCVADMLVAQEIPVAIVGRDEAKLANALRRWPSSASVEAVRADLQSDEGLDRLVALVTERGRPISRLVNAAGVFSPKPFMAHDRDDYDWYMRLNRAAFFVSQAVARNMAANGGGSIVHVGSMWAHQAVAATPSSAYSMAKAGLHSLTQHMAMELAPDRIRVNAVAPAVVKTPIYEAFIAPDAMD